MSLHIKKGIFISLISLSVLACQNKQTVNVSKKENTPKLVHETSPKSYTKINNKPSPCKLSSTPLIKDRNKIKAMLYKQGELTSKMSEEEVNLYVNTFIKNKSSAPCKPTVKNPSNFPNSEKK